MHHNTSQVRLTAHFLVITLNRIHRWLKQNNLDTPDVAHLKRIRKVRDSTTFLISHHLTSPLGPPEFPEDLNLPLPHLIDVPASPALTPTQLRLKTDIWPTLFTPRRKDVPEKWCRGKVAWAWQAIEKTIQIAIEAGSKGEVCFSRPIKS